jgi:hypothetical protein
MGKERSDLPTVDVAGLIDRFECQQNANVEFLILNFEWRYATALNGPHTLIKNSSFNIQNYKPG